MYDNNIALASTLIAVVNAVANAAADEEKEQQQLQCLLDNILSVHIYPGEDKISISRLVDEVEDKAGVFTESPGRGIGMASAMSFTHFLLFLKIGGMSCAAQHRGSHPGEGWVKVKEALIDGAATIPGSKLLQYTKGMNVCASTDFGRCAVPDYEHWILRHKSVEFDGLNKAGIFTQSAGRGIGMASEMTFMHFLLFL
ncbi:hypothetical protein HPB51_020183 [Rhipicephalus microplus]|uniref:Uncharacterized protein n=1 Tax=Rhipicephalus microplus TaxID=6941 RepID=A0A9J6D6W8_RHIMP|nr:hypothetical protein HPB51_020183 [Rhipicephalus microplus]